MRHLELGIKAKKCPWPDRNIRNQVPPTDNQTGLLRLQEVTWKHQRNAGNSGMIGTRERKSLGKSNLRLYIFMNLYINKLTKELMVLTIIYYGVFVSYYNLLDLLFQR